MSVQKLILIGSSTGGPGHLENILKRLPHPFHAKIVIAQHMERTLISSFAGRLNSISALSVQATGDSITPLDNGEIYLCSQSSRLTLHNGVLSLESVIPDMPTYNPLIDLLFKSGVPFIKQLHILPILLTGIGEDGARGLLALKEEGIDTIAESETSAIVYGMPRSAREMGAASRILDLEEIIEAIIQFELNHV